MSKRFSLIIHLILVALVPSVKGQNLIFDFNGVLMGTNTLASVRTIGLGTIMQCALHLRQNPLHFDQYLKTRLFDTLNKVALFHTLDQTQSTIAYDEYGNELPYLMRAWLDGSLSCEHIRKYCTLAINANPAWFTHISEKKAITNVINTIFTPQYFVKTRKIYQECVTFIKACKKQGHKIFALSNWDKESFVLLQKKYADIFNLFDGIVISGDVNTLKPAADIYHVLLTNYNLQPNTCWFIDDQQENVTAACEIGIHGIMCYHTSNKKPDFHRVARTIKKINLANRQQRVFYETTTATLPS